MARFPITQHGFEKLENEIKHLKHVERPSVIQEIATARDFGDLSENAEYHAAKEKQSFIEGRIFDLEDKLSRAEIIDIMNISCKHVTFGATVKIIDTETEEESLYIIVGEYEADLTKKMVSITSPIAKALISKSVGDLVEVFTPKGSKTYEILSIEYLTLNFN
jgi:transcription elongation factor GreA